MGNTCHKMHLYQKSDLNLVLESKEEKKVTSICLLDDLHEKNFFWFRIRYIVESKY